MESLSSDERAARVLELVRGLTTEVHPHVPRLTATLDSPFDDLGIGSLELAELLTRVQDTFGAALPAHVLSSAETPRDLVRAVVHNGAPVVENIGIVAPPGTSPVIRSGHEDGRLVNPSRRSGCVDAQIPTLDMGQMIT